MRDDADGHAFQRVARARGAERTRDGLPTRGRADDANEADARAWTARRASRADGDDANAWMEMIGVVSSAWGGREDDARGRWARATGTPV